jgi:hypothetical protein
MNGQEPSTLTEQRALAARNYYENCGASLVIFSGAVSAMVDGDISHRISEAEAMAEVADLPINVTVIEDRSRTTVQNFVEAAELLSPNLSVGVLAHKNHLPRALRIGALILNRPLVPIAAEDFGAQPEPGRRAQAVEKLLYLKERAFLLGVHAGDQATAAKRDALWAKVRGAGAPLARRALSDPTPYK